MMISDNGKKKGGEREEQRFISTMTWIRQHRNELDKTETFIIGISALFPVSSDVSFCKPITFTSFFTGRLLMPIGDVRSISPPSMSQMLSPEKPLVIVVSPVLDLWNFGSSFDESSASSCCFWMMMRPVMMMRQSRTPIVTEMMRYR